MLLNVCRDMMQARPNLYFALISRHAGRRRRRQGTRVWKAVNFASLHHGFSWPTRRRQQSAPQSRQPAPVTAPTASEVTGHAEGAAELETPAECELGATGSVAHATEVGTVAPELVTDADDTSGRTCRVPNQTQRIPRELWMNF